MSHDWNRREVLAGLLGLPIVLAGCGAGEESKRPEYDGEFVGPSVDLGHRIRDGLHVEPAADAWESTGVVIVGGGIAGLSAARRLHKAGADDFVLLELEKVAGGTARSGASPAGVAAKTAFPWGAHYIPAPMQNNRALIQLLDELEALDGVDEHGEPVVADDAICDDPEERLFYRGKWQEGLFLRAGASDDDMAEHRRFREEINRWVAWRDGRGRRAFAIPTAAASDDTVVLALDRISMADWLAQHNFTSPRLKWLIDYSCRDDYGLRVEQASAWAGLFYFAARIARPGFDEQSLITWPEGNGRLVAQLAKGLDKQLRLGLAAIDVRPPAADGRSGVDVVAVSHDGRTAHGFHAERVVFAAPQFIARRLIRPYREAPPKHLEEFQYGSWLVANLFLRDRPAEKSFPLAWDNVLYDSPSLGYVVATHQDGPDSGPTVFTYYYPFCDSDPHAARQRMLELDWATAAELAVADLSIAHPDLRSLVERVDVMRWGHAMVRPTPGFVSGAARRAAVKPLGNIHFANTDLSGVALFEEAFYHGNRAAEEVLRARGRKFESVL
jgi:protoporphyrinogen oxidase